MILSSATSNPPFRQTTTHPRVTTFRCPSHCLSTQYWNSCVVYLINKKVIKLIISILRCFCNSFLDVQYLEISKGIFYQIRISYFDCVYSYSARCVNTPLTYGTPSKGLGLILIYSCLFAVDLLMDIHIHIFLFLLSPSFTRWKVIVDWRIIIVVIFFYRTNFFTSHGVFISCFLFLYRSSGQCFH